MTSAINIMPVSSGGAGSDGAHWVIVPLDEVSKLTVFLLARRKELKLRGDVNPILDQRVFITTTMLDQMREVGIKVFSFNQRQGEGVYIPAGLPHQVISICRVHELLTHVTRSAMLRPASRLRRTFSPSTPYKRRLMLRKSLPLKASRTLSIRTQCCGTLGCR